MVRKDRKIIKLNTIVNFKGNYADDNKDPKQRRYLLIEKEGDFLFFMKFTSQEEDKKREKLGQIKCLIKIEPKFVECLDMISYPILNQKIKISLTDLENTNYRYFYICSLHPNGCLKPEKFAEICQRFKEAWEDKSKPEVKKKTITLKVSDLMRTKGIPLMSRIGKNIKRYCAKLLNLCFWRFTFLFIIFSFALPIILWVIIKLG